MIKASFVSIEGSKGHTNQTKKKFLKIFVKGLLISRSLVGFPYQLPSSPPPQKNLLRKNSYIVRAVIGILQHKHTQRDVNGYYLTPNVFQQIL